MFNDLIRSISAEPELALGAFLGGLAIVGGAIVAVSAIVSVQWRMVRQAEDLNALKQSMLDQGMSADEIATVIRATPKRQLPFVGGWKSRQCGTAREVTSVS